MISRFRTPFHGQSSARSASRVLLPLLLPFSLFFSPSSSLPSHHPSSSRNFLSLSISNRLALDTIRVRSRPSKTTKTRRVGSEVGLVENSRQHRLSLPLPYFPPSESTLSLAPSSLRHPTTLLSHPPFLSLSRARIHARASFSLSLVESPTIPEFPTWSIRLVHQPRALSRHACSRACSLVHRETRAERISPSFSSRRLTLLRVNRHSVRTKHPRCQLLPTSNNFDALSTRVCSTHRSSRNISIFAKAEGKHLCVVPVWSIRI